MSQGVMVVDDGGGTFVPITDAECDAFERHADDTVRASAYSLILPYDLVRFCRTIRVMRAALREEGITL